MSIRSEIRAALVAQGALSCDEMLAHVPSVNGHRQTLSSNVSVLASSKMVRRAGLSDDGKPLYQLDDWPERAADGTVTPPATRKPAATKAAKVEKVEKLVARKPAKAAKKPKRAKAAKVVKAPPAPIANGTARAVQKSAHQPDASHIVGLQANGDALVVDKRGGAYTTIPAGVVRQLLQFADLRARA
jgi:hypothetical protein